MAWRIPERSLFALLMRSSWWVSLAIAMGVLLLAFAVLPSSLRPGGVLMSLPFFVIASIVGWRQAQLPGAGRIQRVREQVGAMAWAEFAGHLQQAFVQQGYTVKSTGREPVDFELEREGRVTVVSARRWRSAHISPEALKALCDARDQRDAQRAMIVGLGELTDAARAYAGEERVEVWQAPELAARLRSVR